MAEEVRPIYMETTAREIANVICSRFGPWLTADTLTEEQRRECLEEVLAHAVHNGIMTGHGATDSEFNDRTSQALQMAAYTTGYSDAITDIDKGQGVI